MENCHVQDGVLQSSVPDYSIFLSYIHDSASIIAISNIAIYVICSIAMYADDQYSDLWQRHKLTSEL